MPHRSVTSGGISLLCFPPYDRAFAALAARHLTTVSSRTPEDLQAALRRAYPDATVRPRESLAAFLPDAAWYVYRDGRFSPYADDEAWWEAPDAAWVDIDAEGRYVDANAPALDLLALTRDELLRMRSGDLADPDVQDLVAWVWDVVRETGELHSTSILAADRRRPRMAVEYRLVLDAAGDGRHRSWLRQIPLAAAEPVPEAP